MTKETILLFFIWDAKGLNIFVFKTALIQGQKTWKVYVERNFQNFKEMKKKVKIILQYKF